MTRTGEITPAPTPVVTPVKATPAVPQTPTAPVPPVTLQDRNIKHMQETMVQLKEQHRLELAASQLQADNLMA